jgi:hypothetical protein
VEKPSRGPGRPFQLGDRRAGRPKGAKNKATLEAKEVCAKLVDDPEYQRTLRTRMIRGKLAPAVECMIWHYAKCKPTERIDMTTTEMRPLVIDKVSTRAEMLAALGAVDTDAGEDDDAE